MTLTPASSPASSTALTPAAGAASTAASPALMPTAGAASSPASSTALMPAAGAASAAGTSPASLSSTSDKYAALRNAYVASDVPMPVPQVTGQLRDGDCRDLGNGTVQIVTSLTRMTSVRSRRGVWVRVGKYHAYAPEDHVYHCPNCTEMPKNGVCTDGAMFLRNETRNRL